MISQDAVLHLPKGRALWNPNKKISPILIWERFFYSVAYWELDLAFFVLFVFDLIGDEGGELHGNDDETDYNEDGEQTLPGDVERHFQSFPVHGSEIIEHI